MNKALIASFNFNPAQLSLIVAYYKQLESIGYESYFYIDKAFIPYLPNDARCIVYKEEELSGDIDVVILAFPSIQNLIVFRKIKKRFGSKIIYILHEPMDKISHLKKSGFSWIQIFKIVLIGFVNTMIVNKVDGIILASKKAVELYDQNRGYRNRKRYYIPLMFDDESRDITLPLKREFFSYIGTIAPDHSFNEYMQFVQYAIKRNLLPELKFLVASKSALPETPQIMECMNSGRFEFHTGKPMTKDEINEYYAASSCVWNAYGRSMQSGVLISAYMFGSPVIILSDNLSEYSLGVKGVFAIDDNKDCEQIKDALSTICNNFVECSDSCREQFLKVFYYKNYQKQLEEIIMNS